MVQHNVPLSCSKFRTEISRNRKERNLTKIVVPGLIQEKVLNLSKILGWKGCEMAERLGAMTGVF